MKRVSLLRFTAVLLVHMCLALALVPCAAEDAAAVSCLIPSVFCNQFNGVLPAFLESQYQESLGAQAVKDLADAYSLTLTDKVDSVLYLDSENYQLEAIFAYTDNNIKENNQAILMNFLIREDAPDVIAEGAKAALMSIIGYSFENRIRTEDLSAWFSSNTDPANVFHLPGYDLSVMNANGYVQYMLVPPADQNPFAQAPAGAPAESELVTVHCEDQGFVLRLPAGVATEPIEEYGGLCVYGGKAGSIPYIDVFRRPVPLPNPADYLDKVVLRDLEKQNGSQAGQEGCKTVTIGGRSLYSLEYRYMAQDIPMYMNALIWNGIDEAVEFRIRSTEADQEMIMGLLDTVVRYYALEDPGTSVSPDDADQQAYIASWAEERKLARAFTAGFTATLTEQDLLTFVLTHGNTYRYVLGETTPQKMAEDGWVLRPEDDGAYSLYDINEEATGVLLYTEHGKMDEPIVTMNAMFQEPLMVEYCGFDGALGIEYDDPDEYWYPDPTGMILMEVLGEYGTGTEMWDGLVNWLVTDFGAKQTEDGIYEAKIPLKSGRTLYVSSHDSQVRISLAGF